MFLKYIKGDRQKYNTEMVEYLTKYYLCSTTEAQEYYDILTEQQLAHILKLYGVDDKLIKKWSKK